MKKHQLFIQSEKRSSGTSSNFYFNFSKFTNIQKISLEKISLQISFFPVNQYNNKIYFHDGINDYSGALTYGTYTISQLIVELVTKMNGTASALVFDCTYNSVTNKMTITNSTNTPFELKFDGENSIGPILGFSKKTTTGAIFQTSDKVVDLNHNNRIIFIGSKTLRGNIVTEKRNYFHALVNHNTPFGGILYDENMKRNNLLISKNSSLERLNFFLHDSDGNELDLNLDTLVIVLNIYTI